MAGSLSKWSRPDSQSRRPRTALPGQHHLTYTFARSRWQSSHVIPQPLQFDALISALRRSTFLPVHRLKGCLGADDFRNESSESVRRLHRDSQNLLVGFHESSPFDLAFAVVGSDQSSTVNRHSADVVKALYEGALDKGLLCSPLWVVEHACIDIGYEIAAAANISRVVLLVEEWCEARKERVLSGYILGKDSRKQSHKVHDICRAGEPCTDKISQLLSLISGKSGDMGHSCEQKTTSTRAF